MPAARGSIVEEMLSKSAPATIASAQHHYAFRLEGRAMLGRSHCGSSSALRNARDKGDDSPLRHLKGERYAAVQKWFPEQFACSDFILNGQRRNNRHADPGPDRALNRLDVGQFKSLSDPRI